jgi:hypothetical protein
MARLIEVRSPTDGTMYFINADTIAYLQQSNNDSKKCTMHFVGDAPPLALAISAQSFAQRVGG